MRKSDVFPRKYQQSADIKIKPIVATISHVQVETIGQGADQKEKPVLYLENEKPMVLNATNWDSLEDAFGDSDNWTGHNIRIKCTRVNFGGKTVDGLRIEPIKPKPAAKVDIDDEVEIEVA
jgi:hypothetical protein